MIKEYHKVYPLHLLYNPNEFQKVVNPFGLKMTEKARRRGAIKDLRFEIVQTAKDRSRKTFTCNLLFTVTN